MSARRFIPGMRWWCVSAVELRDEVCRDCFNAAVDPVSQLCGSCIAMRQRMFESAIRRIGEVRS